MSNSQSPESRQLAESKEFTRRIDELMRYEALQSERLREAIQEVDQKIIKCAVDLMRIHGQLEVHKGYFRIVMALAGIFVVMTPMFFLMFWHR